jgi:hypothetical protein
MESLPPIERPQDTEVRETEDALVQQRETLRAQLQRAIEFKGLSEEHMQVIRSVLQSDRGRDINDRYNRIQEANPILSLQNGDIVFALEEKEQGRIDAATVATGLWHGDLIRMLQEPIGGGDMQKEQAAKTRLLRLELQSGALTRLLKGETDAKLLGELRVRLLINEPIRMVCSKQHTLLVLSATSDALLARVECGPYRTLDTNKNIVEGTQSTALLLQPRMLDLPYDDIMTVLADRAHVDVQNAKDMKARYDEPSNEWVFTYTEDGTPKEHRSPAKE